MYAPLSTHSVYPPVVSTTTVEVEVGVAELYTGFLASNWAAVAFGSGNGWSAPLGSVVIFWTEPSKLPFASEWSLSKSIWE